MSATERAIYPSLSGRRVLVTGGATGIGAGLVEAFLRQGAEVFFIDILEEEARALAARLEAEGLGGCVFVPGDLRDPDQLSGAFGKVLALAGGLDVLINNAANDDRHAFADVTAAYWDERMAVNLRHLFLAAQAVVPSMKRQSHGVILNLGSISWHLGLKDLVVYQTAKAGIEGMTRALARELGRNGIRVNTIIPGNVQTARQMKWYDNAGESGIIAGQCLDGRIQPHDVAALALFLASDDARMCTAHSYWVDAGWC